MNWVVLLGSICIIFIRCEVIEFNGIRIRKGNVVNLNNYYWKSNDNDDIRMSDQFSYEIDIKSNAYDNEDNNDEMMMMHIFVIAPKYFSKVNILNDQAFCCMNNSISLCTSTPSQISNLSTYYQNYTIFSNSAIKLYDKATKSKKIDNGIYATYIALCPNKNILNHDNISIDIKGRLTYKNIKGFLSYDDYFLIYLYGIIIGYSCIILFIWVYMKIKRDNNSNFHAHCSNTFTITIPLFLIAKIVYFSALIIENQTGTLRLSLVYLKMTMDAIVSIINTLILSGISVGYTLNLQSRLYKSELRNNLMFLPKKNKYSFIIALILYLIGLSTWEISLFYYHYHQMNIIYPVISITILMISNTIIFIALSRRIKRKEHNLTTLIILKNYLRKYRIVLNTCQSINIAYIASICLYKFISKYIIIAYIKWIGQLLFEGQSLILYTTFTMLLITIPQLKPLKKSYVIELADQSYTKSSSTT